LFPDAISSCDSSGSTGPNHLDPMNVGLKEFPAPVRRYGGRKKID
jgi:hypothetical protein